MGRGIGTFGFVLSLIVGLYLINAPFSFVSMPGFIVSLDKWIGLIAGILVIIGGFYIMRASRYSV